MYDIYAQLRDERALAACEADYLSEDTDNGCYYDEYDYEEFDYSTDEVIAYDEEEFE